MKGDFPGKIGRFLSGGKGMGSRPAKETMLILFLSGILIFVILLPVDRDNTSYLNKRSSDTDASASVSPSGPGDPASGADGSEEAPSVNEYKKGLEQELEDFLSNVAGVGKVKVLIYIKASREYIVEKDRPASSSTKGEDSDLTKSESTVYTTNGNGKEVPFISQTKSPAVDGVVVAAEGASDEGVRLRIVRLVMALYGVGANKVEVLAMEES